MGDSLEGVRKALTYLETRPGKLNRLSVLSV
jgi:hypothetical protein